MIALAPHLEDWLARAIRHRARSGRSPGRAARARSLVRLQASSRAAKGDEQVQGATQAASFDGAALRAELEQKIGERLTTPRGELAFALKSASGRSRGEGEESTHADDIDLALRYAAWAAHTAGRQGAAQGRRAVQGATQARLHAARSGRARDARWRRAPSRWARVASGAREGFALSDEGTDLVGALDQAHYCIWCHEQQKDSCSSGLHEKSPPTVPAPAFKKSPFGVTLAGCPLEEKISEFHKLRAEGWAIGALAMICVDNPMVAATGHRICNDCMKSCIYQKQEPVDIPQSETRTLEGRAGAAVGLRALQPADALESARPPASGAGARRRASGCWWSAWARQDSRSRIICSTTATPSSASMA